MVGVKCAKRDLLKSLKTTLMWEVTFSGLEVDS